MNPVDYSSVINFAAAENINPYRDCLYDYSDICSRTVDSSYALYSVLDGPESAHWQARLSSYGIPRRVMPPWIAFQSIRVYVREEDNSTESTAQSGCHTCGGCLSALRPIHFIRYFP